MKKQNNILSAFAIAMLLVMFNYDAWAATINVNTFEDVIGSDEVCSLRQAVLSANSDTAVGGCEAGSGEDTIVLQAGVYTLSQPCDIFQELSADIITDGAICGDLHISDSLIIQGAGKGLTTISVLPQLFDADLIGSNNFRAFYVGQNFFNGIEITDVNAQEECRPSCSDSLTLKLIGLSIEKGNEFEGGAVKVDSQFLCSPAKLVTNDVLFKSNFALNGGAVHISGYYNATNTSFDGNIAKGDAGGVFLESAGDGCDLQNTFLNSVFTNNISFNGGGGGLFVADKVNVSIDGTTFSHNNADKMGGAIAAQASKVSINDSLINQNGNPSFLLPSSEALQAQIDSSGCCGLVSPEYGGGISVGYAENEFYLDGNSFVNINKAELEITNTTISGNQAEFGGGGIATFDRLGGLGVLESNGVFSGILSADVSVRTSLISENKVTDTRPFRLRSQQTFIFPLLIADSKGGGILHSVFGKMLIEDSTIDFNSAAVGAGLANLFEAEVLKSTISNNTAKSYDESDLFHDLDFSDQGLDIYYVTHSSAGGGIYNGGSLTIVNSTLSGNSTDGSGAGLYNQLEVLYAGLYSALGGALGEPGSRLNNVTITDNHILENEPFPAPAFFDIHSLSVNNGGGIASILGKVTLSNTIVADNTDNFAIQSDSLLPFADTESGNIFYDFAPDCYTLPASTICSLGSFDLCSLFQADIISLGNNLIGTNQGCAPFIPAENDIFDIVGTEEANIDPLLDPLSSNGGNTLTHQPKKGSPAIDAGSELLPSELSTDEEAIGKACEEDDQRSVPRPIDGDLDGIARCDIGAVEVQVDCEGVPGGSLIFDECGVCGGDGSSCAETPLVCEEQNIFDTLIVLDGSAHDLAKLSNRVLRLFTRKGGNKRRAKKDKTAAEELRQLSWEQTWAIPTVIKSNCQGGNVICSAVSNEPLKSAYTDTVNQLYKLNQSLISRLRRFGIKPRNINRLRKLNDESLSKALESAANVPAGSLSCS